MKVEYITVHDTANRATAEKIREYLHSLGVEDEKIIWEDARLKVF